MKISIDSPTINEIQSLISLISKEGSAEEVEFRLGKYVNNKFIPGVNKSTFYLILKKLEEKYKFTTTESIVYIYKNNIRKINDTYQRKIKIQSKDIEFSNISVRLSRAIETPLKEIVTKEEPIFTRKRLRYSFTIDYYTIDLTVVRTNDNITYEVEVEFNILINKIEQFIQPLKQLLEIIFPNKNYIIQKEEQLNVINSYNNFFYNYIQQRNIRLEHGKIIRFENRPRNIKLQDIKLLFDSGKSVYSVTNKLNGIGMFLFISIQGIYFLNFTDIDKIISKPHPSSSNYKIINELNGTILHGELFENEYHVFDTLKYKGRDVTLEPHSQRISYATKILSFLSTFIRIYIKNFVYTKELEEDTKNIVRYMYNKYRKDTLDKNDGIIFTPVYQPYLNIHTLKFKFPTTMTIDFYIDNLQQKINGNIFDVKVYEQGGKFIPFKQYKLFVSKDNNLYNELENGIIVEALYDTQLRMFIPTRVREDKDKPNFIRVANDVMYDILNPIELPKLLQLFHNQKNTQQQDCLQEMRRYHNQVKKELILNYTQNKNILDLGFGRAGDIHKYEEANVKFIWAVEPNKDNINEALRRIEEKPNMKKKIKIINLPAQNSGEILDAMNDKKADVVSSFFSLTFFFETENDLDRLINTVAQTLKLGGVFIGTTMDGQKTFEYMKGIEKKEEKSCYTIQKFYSDADVGGGLNKFGNKILINLQDTIVSEQYEWLAFFDIFIEKLKKRGLYLVDTKFFSPPQTVDTRIRDISSLFRTFVFERKESESEKKTRLRKEEEEKRIKEQEEKELNILSMDTVEDFNTDLDPNLIRIGTIGEGSCIFHSVLRAISDEYKKEKKIKRKNIVKELRNEMSEKLTTEQWESFGKGYLSYSLLVPKFSKYFELERLKNNNFIQRAKQKTIELSTQKIESLNEYKNKLLLNFEDLERKKLEVIWLFVYCVIFENFKSNIKGCDVWVGEELDLFEYMSDFLDVDIYIVKDTTRQPYKQIVDCDVRYRNRKSIIILWVGETHYEIIGRKKDNEIELVFNPDDVLIQKIKNIIC